MARCRVVVILTYIYVVFVAHVDAILDSNICYVYTSFVNYWLIRMASIMCHIDHLLRLLVIINDSDIIANLIIVTRTECACVCRTVPL